MTKGTITLVGPQRIELTWPAKGQSVTQSDAGTWLLAAEERPAVLSPLTFQSGEEHVVPRHIVVAGDRLAALKTLRHSCGRQVRLVYADLPRLEGFDESRAFQAGEGVAWNTWLSSLREHFRAAYPLLADNGVIVVQAGDLEESYAKILLFEIFGHSNYLGTIVWQSHYSPKGGKASSDLAAIHENLMCFAYSRSHIQRLALPVVPKDYKNIDADPRGDWQAKQKDAGRDTAKITYNVPPYRWELVDSQLPAGLWRISPMSGVIWGTPSESGTFPLKIQVTDAKGQTAVATLQLEVDAEGNPEATEDVWWRANPPSTGGSLEIQAVLPSAVVGKPYSSVLVAKGGSPYQGTPRPSRGWGFGEKTLIKAILEDRMYFGRGGTSIPEPKKYLSALKEGVSYTNVASWWPGSDAGWTQDATKGLNELLDEGVIKRTNPTSKPETLLARLLDIFTGPDDLVVELFAKSADLMNAAVKKGRKSIGLFGASKDGLAFVEGCAVPRLEHELNQIAQLGLRRYNVGQPLLLPPPAPGASVVLGDSYLGDAEHLMRAILTSQGFFEASSDGRMVEGHSLDGRRRAVVVPVDEFLQQDDVDEFVSRAALDDMQQTIFYFRSAFTLETASPTAGLTLRRVPMDLSI